MNSSNSEVTQIKCSSAQRGTASINNIESTKGHTFSSRLVLLVVCFVGLTFAPSVQAQKFKPADQTKLDTLNKRLEKSKGEEAKAQDVLNQYKVFQVTGRVQAGDNRYASIYGKAIGISNNKGPGSLYEENYLYVKSPLDSQYNADYYNGDCTFEGVVDGRNTYLPIAIQPGYVDASSRLEKWEKISNTIRAEIQTVYLPYQKEVKAQEAKQQVQEAAKATEQQKLAAEKQDREAAQAQAEKEKQNRIAQAREELAQAKREVEQAKINQVAKQDADAEVARLQAETEKLNAEKTRIDAETQKQAQEAANVKAQQLQEIASKEQAVIEKLSNTVSIIPGRQLGKIRLGMAEAEVLQEIGAPDSTLQLRKLQPRDVRYRLQSPGVFIPRKIRRDRYSLEAVSGLDIIYEGSPLELKYFSKERSISDVSPGDLKKDFVFDVFYVNGKVVQLESDSPQFFTSGKENLLSRFSFDKPYETDFVTDHQFINSFGSDIEEVTEQQRLNSNEGMPSYGTTFGSSYIGDRKAGFSLRLEALSKSNNQVNPSPEPFPRSRLKLVIHAPNTTPYTGDYQMGISMFNHDEVGEDADNAEERMYSASLNNDPVSTAVNEAMKPENLKKKLKRKLGDFLP